MKKLPISCMLCNCSTDEPEKLTRALASVWFCDQIVLLSDNSSKESLAIAEKFGCDIHHWTGANSMSARRNHCMTLMKHEYILQCDSDEIYDWDTYYIIRDFIKEPHEEYIYAVRLINVTSAGVVQSVAPLERMFKKGVSWDKEIQNQLKAPTNAGVMIASGDSMVDMYHDGYGDAEGHASKQWKRLPANERMVRADPSDAHTRMFLINALVVAGGGQPLALERIQANVEINIKWFQDSEKTAQDCKVLQKTLRFYYCATSERGKWQDFLDTLKPLYAYVEYHPDSIYWMHRCNYELKNAKEATRYGEKFVKACENPKILQKNIEVTTIKLKDEVITCMISCWQNTKPKDDKEAKYMKKRVKYWEKRIAK